MFFLIFSWLTWNSCHVFEFKFTLANQMHTPASKKKVSHRVLSIAYHTVANLVQLESRFVVTPSWYRTLSVLKFYFQSSWIADGCHRLYTTLYLSVFSQNAGKYGSEKLRIRTLFTQCIPLSFFNISSGLLYYLSSCMLILQQTHSRLTSSVCRNGNM